MNNRLTARRATINDVAREAGTGKTSVSRYLNGELEVLSPDLRERIAGAIHQLNYQPNQMARGLKRGRNRLLGLLLADLTNPYSIGVLQGIEAACHALGYMPIICHAANEVEMERRYVQLLTTYRVEGVIVNALGVKEQTLRPVDDGGIPAVLVDRAVERLGADMVGLDNDAAVRLGMQHLLERGFDEIHFVVQPFEHVSSRRLREAAFHDVLRTSPGIPGDTLVLDLDDATALERALAVLDQRIVAARQAGRRIAFFAANAPVALRIALHIRPSTGPQIAPPLNNRDGANGQADVALISIDDPEWADLAGITTIRQPTYDIGYRAVEFLHERIDGAKHAARECLLPGELIVRASTRG
jgi:LacI family kdg operon repressor